jgi:hypothetical protein
MSHYTRIMSGGGVDASGHAAAAGVVVQSARVAASATQRAVLERPNGRVQTRMLGMVTNRVQTMDAGGSAGGGGKDAGGGDKSGGALGE